MELLWDNLEFIQDQFNENDKEATRLTDMVQLVITPQKITFTGIFTKLTHRI